jgi:hypothetical protein
MTIDELWDQRETLEDIFAKGKGSGNQQQIDDLLLAGSLAGDMTKQSIRMKIQSGNGQSL